MFDEIKKNKPIMHIDVDALEEQALENQVASLMSRVWGPEKRSHYEIERDIRKDNYEMGKVLREKKKASQLLSSTTTAGKSGNFSGGSSLLRQGTAQGTFPSSPSPVLLSMEHFICSSFYKTIESSKFVPYAAQNGLRLFVSVLAERHCGQPKEPFRGRFSLLPPLDDTLRNVKDAAWSMKKKATALDGSSDVVLQCAQDVLTFWIDTHSSTPPQEMVSQFRWKRSLMHTSFSSAVDFAFLPPLPPPCVRMDKYLAVVINSVLSSLFTGSFTAFEKTVLSKGVTRVPQKAQGTQNSDGSGRLAVDDDDEAFTLWLNSMSNAGQRSNASHILVLCGGQVFAVQVKNRQGNIVHMAELSKMIGSIFFSISQTGVPKNASGSFTQVGSLICDGLIGLGPEDTLGAKLSYASLRREALQLPAHEQLVDMLETSLFVLSFDADCSMSELLDAREVRPCGGESSGAATAHRRYPHHNRWLLNALNVAVDCEGQISMTAPSCLAAQPSLKSPMFLRRLQLEVTQSMQLFDELTAVDIVTLPNELDGHERHLIQRCVWATALIFRQLTVVPGKTCLCLLPEQLLQYAVELQRLTTDEEERQALITAADYLKQVVVLIKASASTTAKAIKGLGAFLESCRPYFIVGRHPVLRSPIDVPAEDAEHVVLLTTVVLNPFLTLTRRVAAAVSGNFGSENLNESTAAGDDDGTEEGTSTADPAVLWEAIAVTAPGSIKLSVLESGGSGGGPGFNAPVNDFSRVDPISLFSTLPSREERKRILQAAGKVGFAVARENEALAAVEDQAKRQFQKLLYAQGNILNGSDPWGSLGYRFLFAETPLTANNTPQIIIRPTDIVVLATPSLFRISRAVSRFILESNPLDEDDALMLRFAQPDSVLRGLISLASQLALAHVNIPLDDRTDDQRRFASAFQLVENEFGEDCLVAGGAMSVAQLHELYTHYLFPRLCETAKTAATTTHKAMQICANSILRLVLHHYRPVTADHQRKLVGTVQRPTSLASVGRSTAIDSTEYSKALHRRFTNRVGRVGKLPLEAPQCLSWVTHCEMLDCAARLAPLSCGLPPCVSTRLHHPVVSTARSAPLTISFPPTELLELQPGDNEGSLMRALRRSRPHFLRSAVSCPPQEDGILERSHIQFHLIQTKTTRFVDKAVLETIHVDVRGVFKSDPFAEAYLRTFVRCMEALQEMWLPTDQGEPKGAL